MSKKSIVLLSAAVFSAAQLCMSVVQAQQWPSKPVRVVVPFAPGGGTDLIARPMVQKLSESLGQQFVVDNRGGAAGAIGMEIVARAPVDGYTLMIVSGSFSVTPATRKMSFDPIASIVPVAEIGYTPFVLMVHPSLPPRTTKELIDFVRARPGKIAYASSGLGGLTHLGTELFASMAGLKMIHVPYKSTGAAMIDLLSGQVPVMIGSLLGTVTYFESGRLRPIAVTSAQRWPSQPKLPTVAETLPGYETVVYYGLLAPKGTPQPVMDQLNAEVNRILQDGGVKKGLEDQGMAASGGSAAKFAERIRTDHQRWLKVVKDSGFKIE